MVYFEDNEILIRDMIQSDAQIITDEEIASRYSDTVYLGVGVHNGYGRAQRYLRNAI